jgi:hypothetical protein
MTQLAEALTNEEIRLATRQGKLTKLLNNALEMEFVLFKNAVKNADGTPENQFSVNSEKRSRRVEMWWNPAVAVIICKQASSQGKEHYWMVPLDNIIESGIL